MTMRSKLGYTVLGVFVVIVVFPMLWLWLTGPLLSIVCMGWESATGNGEHALHRCLALSDRVSGLRY